MAAFAKVKLAEQNDFDDDNCRIGTAYTDIDFKKRLCILFLSAKRAYCSAERYPRKGGGK